MARDELLVGLYASLLMPFPPGLAGEVVGDVDLGDLDDGIAGAASHYVNNTRPLTPDHRALLAEHTADVDRILAQLPDDYAREYFVQRRDLARYLLTTR
jgi:hypothetical protein